MKLRILYIICILYSISYLNAQEKLKIDNIENLGGVYESGIIRKFIVSNYPNNTSQKIYISSVYNSFEIFEIESSTKKTKSYTSPLLTESQAFALVDANDKVFIGSSPNGHLMYLNKKEGKIYDLGKAIPGEDYIWDLVYYQDKIFGCTYPNAKIFSYDLKTNKLEDLGKIDENEQYAKSMVSDGFGNLFIGTGFKKSKIKKYNIYSKKILDILPEKYQKEGLSADLTIGIDSCIYVKLGNDYGLIKDNIYQPISKEIYLNNNGILLSKNKKVVLDDSYVKINLIDTNKPSNNKVITNDNSFVSNGRMQLFRLGLGPDNNIYLSTALPLYLMKLNEVNMKFEKIELLGNGEVYSFAENNGELFLFTYSSLAEIIVYNPKKEIKKNYTIDSNPYLQLSNMIDGDWRPFDVIKSNNKFYIASMNGYGKKGGLLVEYNPNTKNVDNTYDVVKNQSITSLASLNDTNIVGGTFIQGGYGSDLVDKFSKLFIWDTKKNIKIYETEPLKGFKKIDALVASKNKIIGVSGNNFFIFDISKKKIILNKPHFLGNMIYNGFIKINDSKIYGVTEDNIFSINLQTNSLKVVYSFKQKVSGGVVYKNGFIYMITKNNDVVRYKLDKIGD